jgi:O-methyltransferase involved in polyketide biosynthesis
VTHFNSPEARAKEDVDFVVDYFGQKREDVEEWLKSVQWEQGLSVVREEVVRETLR